MTTHTPLPVLVLDEHSVPAEHRFDAFHAANAPLFDTTPVGDVRDFWATSRDHLVDEVVVSRLRCAAQTCRRTGEHLRDGTTDWFNVHVFHRGGLRGEAGRDTSVDVHPAQIGFLDFRHPFTAMIDRSDSTWIAVPRERIERIEELGPAGAVASDSTRGRVLEAAVADLCRQLGSAGLEDARALSDGIIDTINSVLDPDQLSPSDHDLGVAMRDFIESDLADLDLGVDSLRGRFHCSRASVYRAFTHHGGVATYIRNQRLRRCIDELSRRPQPARRISEVATRWGFENPSHFNRIFKARFGLPPSAIVGTSVTGGAAPVQGNVAGWLREYHAWTRSA